MHRFRYISDHIASLYRLSAIHIYSPAISRSRPISSFAFYICTVCRENTLLRVYRSSAALPNAVREPFSENAVRPLNALRGRNQRVLREVEHSYLIDEVLCKFYCADSRCAGTRTEFISRWKRADYGYKSYSRAFHRLQVCLAL